MKYRGPTLVEQVERRVATVMRQATKETRRARREGLKNVASTLQKDFKLNRIENLKEKHLNHVVEQWKDDGRKPSWIKNQCTHLRWLCRQIGKPTLLPKKNDDLGIERRKIDYNTDKAWNPSKDLKQELPEAQSLHVELTREFGMRFQEAAKFKPEENHHGDRIDIIHGTKGGRERELDRTEQLGEPRSIQARTERQQDLLGRLKTYLVERGIESLSAEKKTYAQFRDATYYQYQKHGITKSGVGTAHGLRHAYAQDRYREITGWKPPAAMTPEERKEFRAGMSSEQKELDRSARSEISHELGHGRSQVSSNYVGSWVS